MNLSKEFKVGDKVYCIKYYRYEGNILKPTFNVGKTYKIDGSFPNVYGVNGVLFNKEKTPGYRNFQDYFTNKKGYRLRKLRVLNSK